METVCVILTYCQSVDSLYGSTLTFDTLRVGYPDATVHVFDNASIPEVRPEIRRRAEACGAAYHQINTAMPHAKFIRWAIGVTSPGKTLVILDPDLIFWRKIDFAPRALVMGRRIPAFNDVFAGALTHPRLHTSFLSIVDPPALRLEVEALERRWFDLDAIAPIMFPRSDGVERYDTFGVFCALRSELCGAFGDEELDCYDHLFCGTHVGGVANKLDNSGLLAETHELAKTNPMALRGLWRKQEQFFAERAASC